MKLIRDNFAQDSTTTVSASSQKSSYPASNVKHPFRAKEWRSNGQFEITASNKSMTLNEGSPVGVTLTEGTYTPEALALHVAAQLNAAGANTYTVTFSRVTGLWTIQADGVFALSGSFLSIIGFGSLSGDDTYEGAQIAIHTSESVVFDLKTIEEIDTIAVLWESGNFKLTTSAVITLEANATNVWTAPAFSTALTFDNRNEIAQAHFAAESYRYWRIKIQDPQNANLYVNLGVVVLGLADQILTRTSNGFSFSFKDYSKSQSTDFGQFYTDSYPKLKAMSLNFDALDLAETTALIDLFSRVGNSQNIFVSLDPAETILTEGEFWIYGRLSSALGLNHQVKDIFTSGLEIVETN